MSENYQWELSSGNYLLRIMSGNDLVYNITLHGKVKIYNTGHNIKKLHFKTHSRKLGKKVNISYLNNNYF